MLVWDKRINRRGGLWLWKSVGASQRSRSALERSLRCSSALLPVVGLDGGGSGGGGGWWGLCSGGGWCRVVGVGAELSRKGSWK